MSATTRRLGAWGAIAVVIAAAVVGVGWLVGGGGAGDPANPADAGDSSGQAAHGGRTVVLEGEVRHGPAAAAPHVVLVMGCTVRRDQVAPYGGHPDVTPFLAELARDGAMLTDLITAAPWTRAASAGLLTGHHPVGLGMVEPGPERNDRVLPTEVETLAERFAEQGYTTIGATANPNLNAVYGFDQGFDRYLQPAALWREQRGKLSGAAVLQELFEVIDTRPDPDRPLFLQIMFVDAHAPWGATPAEVRAFADRDVPRPIWPYRVGLKRLDDSVRSLWTGLEQRGFSREDTVFVFVSDHGEGLLVPRHHGRSHGRYLYPSAVHGVFLAAGPGIPPGRAVVGVASGVDVPPTLLGLAGLQSAMGPEGQAIDLSPAIRGDSDATARDRAFTDTWFMTANRSAFYESDQACMTSFADGPTPGPTGEFTPGCYDREADPDFERAVPGSEAEGALGAWRAGQQSAATRFTSAAAAPDADLDRQLEALGYVQRDPEETSP